MRTALLPVFVGAALASAALVGGLAPPAGAQINNDARNQYIIQRDFQLQNQQRMNDFLNQNAARQQQLDIGRSRALDQTGATNEALRARQQADVERYRNGLQSQIAPPPPPRLAPHRVPKPPYAMPPRQKPEPPPG
jgi:hypothetical protein